MKKIRKSRGISGASFASAIGLSPTYLVMIENGDRLVPLDFFSKARDCLCLNIEEQTEVLEAISKHPLMIDERALEKEQIKYFWKETIKKVNELFNIIMSSCNIDEERLNKLIQLLQNLRNNLFNDPKIKVEGGRLSI